jgi:UDP-N-acetylmuramyl pentapeptide phosphotransferase/UDP-N-acetylglucosamine-1-phosphate transferase
MLVLIFTSFIFSIVLTVLVRHKAREFAQVYAADMEQRFHVGDVPRLGGLAMLLAFVGALGCAWLVGLWAPLNLGLQPGHLAAYVSFLALPVLVGVYEDLTQRVGVRVRLFTTAVGACIALVLLDVSVQRLGFSWVDTWWVQSPWLGMALALLAMAGLPHAFNIIDGFNGLAGMVAMVITSALLYLALKFGDRELAAYALCTLGVTLGFLVWNYPRGLIFAGDGGAYFWGLNIAIISIMLVQRHPQVSPWFPLLLLIYPVWETLFSTYRKLVRGIAPGVADSMHLHHVIYKRMVRAVFDPDEAKMLLSRNNRTTPYLVALTVLTVAPALLFWHNTSALMAFCALFAITYVVAYVSIVKFKVPRWLRRIRL